MKAQFFVRVAALVVLTFATGHALAGTYCAVFSWGKQCYYSTWSACKYAAGTQGACVINQEEVKPPSGNAPFCTVSSFGTQCYYYDVQSCQYAAKSVQGVCAVNPNPSR